MNRYYWWPYVKRIIENYPQWCAEMEELRKSSVTANYNQIGHGSDISKPTEQAALRLLPPVKQMEFDAVRLALKETEKTPNGRHKIAMIRLMYWQRSHNLSGAAQVIGLSNRAAHNWHGDFICLVAVYYGFIDRSVLDERKRKRRKRAPRDRKTGI